MKDNGFKFRVPNHPCTKRQAEYLRDLVLKRQYNKDTADRLYKRIKQFSVIQAHNAIQNMVNL